MRGTIIGFDQMRGEGVISDDAGNRYNFHGSAWRSPSGPPVPGAVIDFQAQGGVAQDIYPVAGGGYGPGPGAGGFGPGPGGYGPGGYGGQTEASKKALTYGIISLVLGLVSFLLTFVIGPLVIVTLVPELIFGVKAMKLGKNQPDKTGYYLGLAGLILGILGTIFFLILLIGLIFAVGVIGAAGGFR